MRDTVVRALRTFAQGFVGVLVLAAIPAARNLVDAVVGGNGSSVDIDLTFWRNVALAAIAGGVIALVSFLHNLLEDKGALPNLK